MANYNDRFIISDPCSVCGGTRFFESSGKCETCVRVEARAKAEDTMRGKEQVSQSFEDQRRVDKLWRPTEARPDL